MTAPDIKAPEQRNASLTPALVQAMLKQMSLHPKEAYHIDAIVLRSALTELLRFMAAENQTDKQKILFAQYLTLEYAYLTVSDVVKGLRESDLTGIAAAEALTFLENEFRDAAKENQIKLLGAA